MEIHEGRRRFSVAHLLVALTVLLVVLPFADRMFYGKLVESVLFTVVLLTGVSAVGGQRQILAMAAALVAPAILSRWIDHFWPGVLPASLGEFLAIAFVFFVIWHLFRFVIKTPQVNEEVLCAAVSIYLLFAIACSLIYTLLAQNDPGAFRFTESTDAHATLEGFNALYYSMQVLTTIGFGDILPLSRVARMVAIVEATVGLFFVAILVARLVGLYSRKK